MKDSKNSGHVISFPLPPSLLPSLHPSLPSSFPLSLRVSSGQNRAPPVIILDQPNKEEEEGEEEFVVADQTAPPLPVDAFHRPGGMNIEDEGSEGQSIKGSYHLIKLS